jgi:hypothetical protein
MIHLQGWRRRNAARRRRRDRRSGGRRSAWVRRRCSNRRRFRGSRPRVRARETDRRLRHPAWSGNADARRFSGRWRVAAGTGRPGSRPCRIDPCRFLSGDARSGRGRCNGRIALPIPNRIENRFTRPGRRGHHFHRPDAGRTQGRQGTRFRRGRPACSSALRRTAGSCRRGRL